jgi:transmembrane sensor
MRLAAEAAAHWYLILHDDGEPSPVEREAFLAWLRVSPRHVAEYLAVAELHGDLPAAARRLSASSEQLSEQALRDDGVVVPLRLASTRDTTAQRKPRHRRNTKHWAIAAMLALGLGFGLVWLGQPTATAPAQRYVADADAPREVELSDGSRVSLDRGAAIEVAFDTAARCIVLLRGNALFDVRHDPARPLSVRAGAVALHDIGTVFSVRRDDAGANVTVLSGRVQLRPPLPRWFARWRPSPGLLADLHGGERAQVNAQGEVASVDTHADIAEATAWLPDQATLRDLPLAEVARRFNAYTLTPLAIEDTALAARRVSGVFHLRDSEAFVAYLASLPGVHIEHEPDRIRVLASR